MMENKITMSNNNKKEGNDMNAFETPNNTINIVLQVNPEKLVGKTYKEMVEALAKTIIQNNVSVQGEMSFPIEYGKFYDINQEGIIKRASVDEFDVLIVALDVPFIQTDHPTPDSICAELPENDEDEYDEYYYDEFEDYYDKPFSQTDSEYMKEHGRTTVAEYLEDVDRSIKDFEFSLGGYVDYEYKERILHYSDYEMMYINDAIGYVLTPEEIKNSVIGNITENRISIYPKEETNMNNGTVTENTGKTYKELKEFGIFELMPNGFNVYLDDEDMVKSDDSFYAHLEYNLDENVYKTPNGITMTSEELMESTVTFIGSDPMGDFEVPALWIIPNDAWYERQKRIDEMM